MKKREWLKETARDIVALGSLPFFLLVVARVVILPNQHFLSQFIFAGIIFFLLMPLFKQNLYSGLGLILLVLVSLYYNNLKFTVFASLLYTGLIISLIYLKTEKQKIIKGVLSGALSTAASYFLVRMIFNEPLF